MTNAATGRSELRRFLARPVNVASLALVLLLVALAVLAPVISPYPPDAVLPADQWLPPDSRHWMGTDQHGRDVMSRALYGARISLFVGIATVVLAMAIGVTAGLVAGYIGGIIDEVIMGVMDVLLSLPGVVLALAIVGILGPQLYTMIGAMALYRLAQFARQTRGSVLSVMRLEYVIACRAVGMGDRRIALRHVLPNCAGPIIVLATVLVGNVILTEATLSFLGMGVQPPQASWGAMIAGGNEYLTFAPWISLAPGLLLMLAMIGFNLLGDGLRDHLDPRDRTPA